MANDLSPRKYIYWKHKDHVNYNRSFLFSIIKTDKGNLLEIGDTEFSKITLRILETDIDILIQQYT